MKVIEAEASSSEDSVVKAPPSPMRAWRWTAARRQTAHEIKADSTRQQGDEEDAPSGWWMVPAVIGGLLFWIWLIRLGIGWLADLS